MQRIWVITLIAGMMLSSCLGWRPEVPEVDRAFISTPRNEMAAKPSTPPFSQFAKAPWLGKMEDLDAGDVEASAEGASGEDGAAATDPDADKKMQSKKLNQQAFKFIQDKDFAQAEKILKESLDLDPRNLAALTNMGVVYENTGKLEMARKMYRKAILANPQALLKVSDPSVRTGQNKKILDVILGEWNKRNQEKEEAMRLKGDIAHGQKVYKDYCSEKCHQPDGWGDKEGKYPQIAGQYKDVTLKQLADIRSKNRDNPEMYRFSLPSEIGGVQNMADVAAYIEAMAMTDTNGKGPGKDLQRGKQLYDRDCAACHGANGEGDSRKMFELVYGQHYNYLMRQFQWIKDEKRRNGHPLMIVQVEAYTPEEITAVMDYMSRMAVPDHKKRPLKLEPLPGKASPSQSDKDSLL